MKSITFRLIPSVTEMVQIKGKSHAVHAKMLRKTDVGHGITFRKHFVVLADPNLTRKNISDCF